MQCTKPGCTGTIIWSLASEFSRLTVDDDGENATVDIIGECEECLTNYAGSVAGQIDILSVIEE